MNSLFTLASFNLKFKGISLEDITQGFADVPNHPFAIIALIGLVILIAAIVKMKKIQLTTTMITQIGIALALGTVLKMIKFYQAPMGGSATLGSMVPIFLIALFYGPEVGFLTGLLFGIIDFILGPYILHPIQVLFDYPLPFIAIGLAGYFKDKEKPVMLMGVALAILARFACHFISGVVFFGSSAPAGTSPALYSFLYNITYLGPDGLLCLVILALLPIKQLNATLSKTRLSN
jgi:thiamine transporter